jgi:hypothetical protein
MTEQIPTPSELAAYRDILFELLSGTKVIFEDAAARGESQEIVNQRIAHFPHAVVVDDGARAVDAYLSQVEDDSPLHPLRQAVLGQVLARMFPDG